MTSRYIIPQEDVHDDKVDDQVSLSSLRWSANDKRAFLECLAATGNVTISAESVGKSVRSAYIQRNRRDGAGFRHGWQAAILLARACLTDALLHRALEGQDEYVLRDLDDGSVIRTRHDNRLGMALLNRLDTMATSDAVPLDINIAQMVMLDFEVFLDLIENDNENAVIDYINQVEMPLIAAQLASLGFDADQCELAPFSAISAESLMAR